MSLSTQDDTASTGTFVAALHFAVQNERFAPDILPYPAELLRQVFGAIAEKKKVVDAALASPAPNTMLPFRAEDILRIELQRVQFLTSELLRIRVKKIYRLAFTIQYQPSEYEAVLSPDEMTLATAFAHLSKEAMLANGLSQLPPILQHLTPSPPFAEGEEILERPALWAHVFVLLLEDVGTVDFGQGALKELKKGDIVLCEYRTFQSFLREGKARLV